MSRRILVALLAVLAVLDLAVLGIRLGDTLAFGRLSLLPSEGPVLYAIWKVQHGYPLYEWPFRPPYALTLYNFLFYESYAWILAACRAADDSLPIAGRLITFAFAALGAAAQYAAVRRLMAVPAGFRPAALMIAIATWFGAVLPGWWTLAIRPDVPAAALSTCGIVAAATAFGGGSRRWLLAAGVAFAAVWTFKQSQVALFVATCLYVAVWRRSLRELMLVASPFVVTAAVALGAGGGLYRANILDAPRVNALIPYLVIYWYRSVVLTDVLLWGVALYAIVAIARPGSAHGPLRSLDDVPARSRTLFDVDVTYPAVATVMAFAAGSVLLAKVGSALNHILELNVAASLVCTMVLAAAWQPARGRGLFTAAAVLLLPMIAFQAVLLRDRGGRPAVVLQLKGPETALHLTTPETAASRQRLAALVTTLPHPLFTDDETFAQPRYATGGTYPTVILDHVFYDAAWGRRLVGRGVEGMFADHEFAAALVTASSGFVTVAEHAGYRQRGVFQRPHDEPLYILVRD